MRGAAQPVSRGDEHNADDNPEHVPGDEAQFISRSKSECDAWDIHTIVEHARGRGADPWATYTAVSQTVTPSMLNAVGAGVRRGWQ